MQMARVAFPPLLPFRPTRKQPPRGLPAFSTGTRSADIWVVTAEKAAALYPGVDFGQTPGKAFAALRIRVASLDKARGVLDANGVSHVTTPAGIAVLPENASGTVLEFSEQ